MAFPPDDLCIALPAIPTADDICLPGGFCLSYVWDGINKIPTAADVGMDFFSQIGPALAPLVPLFNVIDTAITIFRCVKAIPDAITSLDPSELIKCLPVLAKLVDQLLKLIPQLSIPKMVKTVLNNLAAMLESFATELFSLKHLAERIAAGIDRAADLQDVKMNGFLVCAQGDLEDTVLSTSEALKGIGRIILLVNIFMGLIGAEEIPCFGSLIEDNLDDLELLSDLFYSLAEVLRIMASVIPDPDLALTIALGDLKC